MSLIRSLLIEADRGFMRRCQGSELVLYFKVRNSWSLTSFDDGRRRIGGTRNRSGETGENERQDTSLEMHDVMDVLSKMER
jgi:hypothetical protein